MKTVISKRNRMTRQNIMEGFFRLYKKERIEKITVSQICEVSGYNRSTFYEYFNDIYAVLDAVEEELLPEEEFKNVVFLNLMMMQKSNASQEEIEEETIRQVLNFFETKEDYMKVLLGEKGDIAFRRKLLVRLKPIIMEVMHFKMEKDSIRAEFIMEYQSAAVMAIIAKWYASEKPVTAKELISLIVQITSNGVKKEMLRYSTKD